MSRITVTAGVAAFCFLVPSVADAANQYTFCMRWAIQCTDCGAGEDHFVSETLMRARGAKVQIFHPQETHIATWTSESSGCFMFSSNYNSGFTIKMWAQARIGGTNNITVTAYGSETDYSNGTVATWNISANPGGSGGTFYYQNSSGVVSNLLAWAVFPIYWIDSQTSPRLTGTRTLKIVNNATADGGSNQPDQKINLQPNGNQKKFLIGHEVGHWIQRQWQNGSIGSNTYGYLATDVDCQFSGVGNHALRSAEDSSGGFIEGTAHYLSALAYNNHATPDAKWRYYKDVSSYPAYTDVVSNNYVVDVEGVNYPSFSLGGVNRWLEVKCASDVAAGRGVELDWMRFWWDYRTNTGTQPGHWNIFKHLQETITNYAWGSTNAWQKLLDSIDDPDSGSSQFETRFINEGGNNGNDH